MSKFLSLDGLQAYDARIKAHIASAVSGKITKQVVNELPAVSAAQDNVIYLVPRSGGSGTNVKDEYLLVGGAFERIGSTDVDLTGYATTGDVSSAVAGKATKVASATNGNLAGLNASGDLTDSGKKPADFATSAQGAKADTALQPADVTAITSAEIEALFS